MPVPVIHEKKVLHEVEKFVDVPRPYEVIRKVPYEVRGNLKAIPKKNYILKKNTVPVDRPYQVNVPSPYPVYHEKKVPYIVEKHINVPV